MTKHSETFFPLIPEPKKINSLEGSSHFIKGIFFSEDAAFKNLIEDFTNSFQNYLKIPLSLAQSDSAVNARLVKKTSLHLEAYELTINHQQITIKASYVNGFFYGLQTLFQLLILAENYRLSNCILFDEPRFQWRGLHLDESRHFFGKEFVKKMLHFASLYKMNRFHWHLTDDNGWRIEIKRYPKLHEIASKRIDREYLAWKERDFPIEKQEEKIYSGYYTQADIAEIVEFAEKRCITIVPEIEMPGHCRAVFAAYPQFSCTGEERTVASGINLQYRDVFCAGKEAVYQFLTNILAEITALFPGEYIHLGGDEVNPYHWLRCPECRKKMRENQFQTWQELQHYFMQRMTKAVKKMGKTPILWDEILDSGELSDTLFMLWRKDGKKSLQTAIEKKNQVILCPNDTLYFDWKQEYSPLAKGAFGVTPLTKIYSCQPDVTSDEKAVILGLQGNIWTEFMNDSNRVEYMSIPRICALSDIAWTDTDLKNWEHFCFRLKPHEKLFRLFQMNYFRDKLVWD